MCFKLYTKVESRIANITPTSVCRNEIQGLFACYMLYWSVFSTVVSLEKRRSCMDSATKHAILARAKTFFKNRIASSHIDNTLKLNKTDDFNYNPFLIKYLAQFAFKDTSPDSIAKALLYPRVLGTSINTTFGNNIQFFCNDVLSAYASTTSGIDIEFIDFVDGRKKYCQLKAGPNTINSNDVETIKNHFQAVKNLARTNHLTLATTDCIVCVVYGKPDQLSSSYRKIDEEYPVFIGRDFWYRLTGDLNFYTDLIQAFVEAADELGSSAILDKQVSVLADDIRKNGL